MLAMVGNKYDFKNRKNIESIWKAVKKIRLEYAVKDCPYRNLYSEVVSQVNAVEQILQINSTDIIYENITTSVLKDAGEMFIYLNSCSDLLKPWFLFYTDLFQNQTIDVVILTLNRIMKNKGKKENQLMIIAEEIFEKTSSLLKLKYQEIENVTHGIESLSINNSYMASVLHPVHFMTEEGNLSPSAFIPFCEFGGNMSAMSITVKEFQVPICNSFKAKIFNDQLCYEVDLNKFSNKDNIESELKTGLILLMDFNEDRQVTYKKEHKEEVQESYASKMIESDDIEKVYIYLDTVGKH